jgi:hypothetical protein
MRGSDITPESQRLADTLHTRVVRRACDLLGGPEALAERLSVALVIVRAWTTGKLAPPPRVFFRIVDILHEASPEVRPGEAHDAAKPPAPE